MVCLVFILFLQLAIFTAAISNGSEKESRWGNSGRELGLRAAGWRWQWKSWSSLKEAGETQKAAESKGGRGQRSKKGEKGGGGGSMEPEGEEEEVKDWCALPREPTQLSPRARAERRWLPPEQQRWRAFKQCKSLFAFFSQDMLSDFAVWVEWHYCT